MPRSWIVDGIVPKKEKRTKKNGSMLLSPLLFLHGYLSSVEISPSTASNAKNIRASVAAFAQRFLVRRRKTATQMAKNQGLNNGKTHKEKSNQLLFYRTVILGSCSSLEELSFIGLGRKKPLTFGPFPFLFKLPCF